VFNESSKVSKPDALTLTNAFLMGFGKTKIPRLFVMMVVFPSSALISIFVTIKSRC